MLAAMEMVSLRSLAKGQSVDSFLTMISGVSKGILSVPGSPFLSDTNRRGLFNRTGLGPLGNWLGSISCRLRFTDNIAASRVD